MLLAFFEQQTLVAAAAIVVFVAVAVAKCEMDVSMKFDIRESKRQTTTSSI